MAVWSETRNRTCCIYDGGFYEAPGVHEVSDRENFWM